MKREAEPLSGSSPRWLRTIAERLRKDLRMSQASSATYTMRPPLKESMAEQLGELADLSGAGHAGGRTSRQADFQGLAFGGGKLGEHEDGARGR